MEFLGKVAERYPNFGIPEGLKPEQVTILQTMLDVKHCLGVLPTGYGKTWIMILYPHLLTCHVGLLVKLELS